MRRIAPIPIWTSPGGIGKLHSFIGVTAMVLLPSLRDAVRITLDKWRRA